MNLALRNLCESAIKSWIEGRSLVLTIAFCSVFVTGYGQNQEVSGTVSDANTQELLPGVNVSVQGTTRGTSTDEQGEFTLQVPSLSDTLVFSFVGYESMRVPINQRTTINVQMTSTIIAGGEMVVVGYGQQRQSSLTGSISSVPSEELNTTPVESVEEALQGRVAGVNVTSNGGPGEEPVVQIRGISSISYATDPLYVIDGLPSGNLASIDSKDIASVEVLKDASAAAIYGSRGTNGVILITTKKGGEGEGGINVSFDSYIGTQSPSKKVDLLSTSQYLEYERELNGNAGISRPPRLESDSFNNPIYEGADRTYAETNTDWQDAYFRDGMLTNQHLAVSGGNENTNFYISGGYYKQNGIAVGLNYERGNFRVNSAHDLSDVFTIGENLYMSRSKQRYDNTTGNRTRLVNVVRSLPYLPVHDPTTNGGFRNANNSIDGADPTNPIEDAMLLGDAHNNTDKLLGTAFVDANIAPWLTFRSTFGVDYVSGFQHQFSPIFDDKGRSANVATITNVRDISTTTLLTQQLTFDQQFGKHHINAVAVYEQQSTDYTNEQESGNQGTNSIETLAGATNVSNITTESETRLISYVGRLSYDFENKYLLNLAIRRDGLSIWAPGNKWANFPSGSIGWRIDQESFMQDQNFISELKLRGGYGVTGLNGLLLGTSYPWQVTLQANGATYPFNNTNSIGNASYYNELGNPDMSWEKTEQLNVGLDLGILSNKITLTAEYYQRTTDNLLLQVPTPTSFGFNGGGVLANVAEMENNGFDLQLGYNSSGEDFTWNATGLISITRNEVVALNTPNASIGAGGDQDFGGGGDITRTEAGEPIQSFYGYIVDGIFQTQQEVDGAPTQANAAPGDIRFRDLNNDGVINSEDQTFIGSYIPDFSYSLNFNAQYKNFDLSLFLQGVQGNDIFAAQRIIREGMARLFGAGEEVLDAWTPENTDTDIPRAISGDPNQNVRPSTRWIEDGSYLRLKNVQIGYNIPAATLQSLTGGALRDVRVYVSGQNLLTFTGYDGWDPEIGSKNTTLTNGIDYGQYPVARSFLFGVNIGW